MVDRYTKAVLTVIAAALLVLVGQNLVGPTRAQLGTQQVEICGGLGQCITLSPVNRQLFGKTFTTYAVPVVIEK